jgi:ABC-type transport system involved in multi-copper enzyme maturation permease subunit
MRTMTLDGIRLVARQEVRTRLRTGRWRTLLAVWCLAVNVIGLLFRLALASYGTWSSTAVPMFGCVLLAVLVLTLFIAPALGAQAINGERERGTLAALQITRLAPGDIVVGKLAAAWGVGLVVLALALPGALLPVVEGEIGIGRAVISFTVTGLLIGIVCAISIGWSAVVVRGITSVLMSYLSVFGLLIGTVVAFTLALPFTEGPIRNTYGEYEHTDTRTDRVWWLLAPNPVLVLADASPREPEEYALTQNGLVYRPNDQADPLGGAGDLVRDARAGHSPHPDPGPVWPYGLAIDLALAGGALLLATRRLETPVRLVPKGVRIA